MSESEWEYAARAGTTTRFSFMTGTGYGIDNTSTVIDQQNTLWSASLVAVGTYPPNRWGLYNVHGNVREWVEDCWHSNYNGAPTDGSAWTTSCTNSVGVLRSGSGSIFNIRSASRSSSGGPTEGSIPANDTGDVFGFRIARTLPITIVSPLPDRLYYISSSDGSPDADTVAVRVDIRVLDENANVSMSPRSDVNGNPIVAPISPVAFPLTGKERSAEFIMTATGTTGNTIITIVITDDAGNSEEMNIRAEALPIPAMVRVPAGSFMMGARDKDLNIIGSTCDGRGTEANYYNPARPRHQVTISKPFEVGVYEVTIRQFKAWRTSQGRGLDAGCSNAPEDLNKPVTCATLDTARQYASWLSRETGRKYRLLSESEWEYAARAGTTTTYAFQTGPNTFGSDTITRGVDAIFGVGVLDIADVGSLRMKPNRWGLYDVHGNAREWVEDSHCWHDNYNNAPADGSAWLDGCAIPSQVAFRRVIRGGYSFDKACEVTSWSRGFFFRFSTAGFRIARDLP